jgi:hypothetical protein
MVHSATVARHTQSDAVSTNRGIHFPWLYSINVIALRRNTSNQKEVNVKTGFITCLFLSRLH